MRFFCINTLSAADRRSSCEQEFAKAGIEVQFVRGLDARLNGVTNTQPYVAHGRTGCYLSHLRLIDEISRYEHGVSVIFEDDIKLADGFRDKLERGIRSLPAAWDVAYIGWWPHHWHYSALSVYPVNADWQVIRKGGVWGTYGYVVNGRKGADKLLRILHPIATTVDDQMFAGVIAGRANGFFSREALVHSSGGFDSLTQLE